MPTEAQLAANRANAAKSTGPRTAAGKSKSAENAWKHGLTAAAPIRPNDDPSAFRAFESDMIRDLSPQSTPQAVLAQQLILTAWKLRRCPEIEAKFLAEESARLDALDQQAHKTALAQHT